jgi:farnesyl diphosphate synthase
MVLGQAQDMAAEKAGRLLTLPEITALQAGKTGALFGFAASAGAVLAAADPGPLEAYARALGLAFQITDDLLDAEGDPAQAGKALRKDAEAGKATFLTHLGLEGARARAKALAEEAAAALAPYGKRAEALQAAAFFAVERQA